MLNLAKIRGGAKSKFSLVFLLHLLLPPSLLVIQQHLGHLLHQLRCVCALFGRNPITFVSFPPGLHLLPFRIVGPIFPSKEDFLANSSTMPSTDTQRLPCPQLPVSPHTLGKLILIFPQLLTPRILIFCYRLSHRTNTFARHNITSFSTLWDCRALLSNSPKKHKN
uniref:Secreted protein n=1 Tax=Glycine max TaxID=3847 RepID=C6SXS6_SOYBN|nr:unknown [Glycine max]